MVAQRLISCAVSALKVGNVTRQTRELCALQQAAVAETLGTSSNLSAAWESLPTQPAKTGWPSFSIVTQNAKIIGLFIPADSTWPQKR